MSSSDKFEHFSDEFLNDYQNGSNVKYDATDAMDFELKDYIDEEMLAMCDMDAADVLFRRVNELNNDLVQAATYDTTLDVQGISPNHVNVSDSSSFDFNAWMLDAPSNENAFFGTQDDFSKLFDLPKVVRREDALAPSNTPMGEYFERSKRRSGSGKKRYPRAGKVVAVEKRSVRSTSKYRGVTHHCRTGRYEAHIWESGKQVYLGGFDSEEQAALAYDMCAVKCRGRSAQTNFDMRNYAQELANLDTITKDDLVLSLRRQSKGFCKGSSKFRGVTRHAKGKFEARIGQLVGKKYRYLGLYDSEQEAAMAYDVEAVRQKGLEAVTNFDISEYSEILAQHYSQQKVTTRLSSKRKPTSNSSNDKMAEREFRSELAASKHVDLTMRQMKPGPAVEAEPSEHAIDTVRDFFDAEARVRADAKANADMLLRKTSLITEAEETDEAIQELQTLVEQAQTALRDSRVRLQQARASRVK